MLIKSVTKKGDAVPLSPLEALSAAVVRGLQMKNDSEFIYWGEKSSVSKDSFHSTNVKDDTWEAFAEGTVMVGKTRVEDDQFYVARKHKYKIAYKSAKDEIGIHDIAVTSFEVEKMVSNPSDDVGPVDRTNTQVAPAVGELQPSGGVIAAPRSSKLRKR